MFWLGFLIGFLVSAPVIWFILALLTSSKKADEQSERYERMAKNASGE